MSERDDLDDLLALARSRPMEPSDALMARVLADALAEQPKAAVARAAPVARGSWLGGLASVFGGFGGLAGVGGAAVAGLVLGFVQPATVTDFADAVLGTDVVASVTLIPSADALLVVFLKHDVDGGARLFGRVRRIGRDQRADVVIRHDERRAIRRMARQHHRIGARLIRLVGNRVEAGEVIDVVGTGGHNAVNAARGHDGHQPIQIAEPAGNRQGPPRHKGAQTIRSPE